MSEQKIRKRNRFQPGNKHGKGRQLGSRNAPPPISKEQLLNDIETLYQDALQNKQLNVALQAKVWQGKVMGVFRVNKLPNILRFEDMTDEQLEEFISVLEKNNPDVKNVSMPHGEE